MCPLGHHRRRAPRRHRGVVPGRRPPGAHHRGAHGGRHRFRPAGPRGHGQHGGGHRRRHHGGRGHLLGGIVTAQSIRVAGDELDNAIIQHIKKEYSLLLGERTAEQIKITIGSAYDLDADEHTEIRGRDLVSGLPKTVVISAAEVRKAIEEPVNAIVDAVKTTLDKCPPELSGDIMDRGIVLTGGGALLRGLDERLRRETGMPIHIAEDPLDSVALGSGKCVEEFEALQQVLDAQPRR